MASEQTAVPPTAPAIPKWVEASLFEPVAKEIVNGFKQIKNFKAYPALGPGENYATLMLRIEIDVELKDGSSKIVSLMLKTAHDNELLRESMKRHNVFDVESTLYREVVPEFEQLYKDAGVEVTFGPKSFELATNEPYILLEDLRPRGFKNENRLEGLDMDHTLEVLRKSAQWHAASAVRVATKGPYKPLICESFFREESRELVKVMFGSLADIFLKCAKSYEGHESYYEILVENKDKRLDSLYEASKADPNDFNVLNHGDCWSNNVMFKHDAFGKIKETYLVDYQVPRYGSPVQDLFYFLLSSTKYDIKLKQFDYFIKYYHDCLIENLTLLKYPKKMPTLRDIHIQLHKRNAWAMTTVTGVMCVVLLDPNENAKFENFASEDDAGTQFKMQMYINSRCRKHMEIVLPWLHNRGAL